MEHLRKIGTGKELLKYDIVKGATGLTKLEALVKEQQPINQYGIGRFGGQLLNRNNAIDPSLWPKYGVF